MAIKMGFKIILFLSLTSYVFGSSIYPDHDDDYMHPKPLGSEERDIHQINNFDRTREYWFTDAQKSLISKVKLNKPIEKKAKNVILFLGDGFGVSTLTAARILKGQQGGGSGEEAIFNMDTFPYVGTSKTYCLDKQVADSACSSTAYTCGTKANGDTIGVSPEVTYKNCTSQMKKENHLESILVWAQRHGKSTGVITTTRITHASPTGNYGHIAFRDWENDAKVRADGFDPDFCDDIAEQLILREPGLKINVILGGGRREFTPNTTEDPGNKKLGLRADGVNLIEMWKTFKGNLNGKYVATKDELLKVDTNQTDYLLGLFNYDHIEFTDKQEAANNPQLNIMTEVAIRILSKNPNGFYLFVEGGRIDHAHHDTNAGRALEETIQFDKAIGQADLMTEDSDTLIVVTADHSHVMTLNGYSNRGNDILGVADRQTGSDGIGFSTLSYANGPGHRRPDGDNNCSRANIREEDFEHIDYVQHTMVPLSSETHGGEDVLIFAKGPYAHLLSGVNQQSFIPHVMAYAACISPFANSCAEMEDPVGSSVSIKLSFIVLISSLSLLLVRNV